MWLPYPAFLGAHKWAEMLHNLCILGGPQTRRDKLRMGYAFSGPQVGGNATKPLHSRVSPRNRGAESELVA